MTSTGAPSDQPKHHGRPGGGVLPVIAVVLSVVALGLGAWAALRPSRTTPAEQSYAADQQTDAKAALCAATDVVRRGVALNTNLQSPGGAADVTGSLAVAANARLALSDGGLYLLARLEPTAPAELAQAVKKFANTLIDVGAFATAGVPNSDPEQAVRLRDADAENARLAELCK